MRKQIAAANWKMNNSIQEGKSLLESILQGNSILKDNQQVLFAVPSLYLSILQEMVNTKQGFALAAQNCHHKPSGAFTGEVSAAMLNSIGIHYCVIGHSERREYFAETSAQLAEKINLCLSNNITPVFCCGEPLSIREEGIQNEYVAQQLKESLYHLDAESFQKIIIAYEPIWAIGTGKTASSEQAQEMHGHIRSELERKYGKSIADSISILYGGSVKGNNALELFSQPDVDGGLVGGASLNANEFIQIIQALK